MKIAIVGTGAMGSVYAGLLGAAGHEVWAIDTWVAHVAAIAADGSVAGVTLHVLGEGQVDGVGRVLCRAVVLASGGLGQVFSQTTNPSVTTGDGMALAFRAGARLRDLEFVQFHPTVLWLGGQARGQQPLISEALRGEGAFLVDHEWRRFLQGQHPLADLAPRDVVAKAIEKGLTARRPRTRYAIGMGAKPVVYGSTLLPDRVFDGIARQVFR